jgi:hypothetical protein
MLGAKEEILGVLQGPLGAKKEIVGAKEEPLGAKEEMLGAKEAPAEGTTPSQTGQSGGV